MGLTRLAEIGAHGMVAGPDSVPRSQPANAVKKAIGLKGLSVHQLDFIETYEAFAAVSPASMEGLGVDPRRVNVSSGAIAIGHRLAVARITLHAALELARLGSGCTVAALRGAGDRGDGLVLRAD
ncbi:hypothetical protein AAHS21_15050 [Mycobacterium sp. 050272]|uniref:hypothetical protein n=1 Tax=Mycobacterium sp. 050272 TaxID=3142488 RepID=UPI00318F6C16